MGIGHWRADRKGDYLWLEQGQSYSDRCKHANSGSKSGIVTVTVPNCVS